MAVGVTAYSSVLETISVSTAPVDFPLAGLGPELHGFRIAQISDLHFGPYTGESEVCAAIDAAHAAAPDLIVLTGDFVTANWLFGHGQRRGDEIVRCAELLRNLQAPFGVFAVLGNHDWGTDPDRVAGALQDAGIRVLRNQAVAIEKGNDRLWLAGTDCAMARAADLHRTLAKVPAGEPVVLLAHEPDFADEVARFPVEMQLSGHAHGGQIVIPGFPGYLPPLGRKYPRGLYTVGKLRLYTNRGIGVSGAPLRFGAPPEVTIATLQSPLAGR